VAALERLEIQEGIEYFEEANRLDPCLVKALVKRGNVYLDRVETETSEDQEAQSNPEGAKKAKMSFKKATECPDAGWEAHYGLARSEARIGEDDKRVRLVLVQAIKLNKSVLDQALIQMDFDNLFGNLVENVETDTEFVNQLFGGKKQAAERFALAGQTLVAKDDPERGHIRYLYAQRLDEKNPIYPHLLGQLAFESGPLGEALGEAIKQFQLAVELEPDNAIYHLHAGNAYKAKARSVDAKESSSWYEHALNEYTLAEEYNPDYLAAYVERGDLYMEIAEKEPTSSSPVPSGSETEEPDKFALARADFESAIQKAGDNPLGNFHLARLEGLLGNTQQALELLTIESMEKIILAWSNLEECRDKSNDSNEEALATKALERIGSP
jgi:tetratricopeptide (TPR) repeat protein